MVFEAVSELYINWGKSYYSNIQSTKSLVADFDCYLRLPRWYIIRYLSWIANGAKHKVASGKE